MSEQDTSRDGAEKARRDGQPETERRGISSLAIRRPIGTLMISSVVLVLGVFFLSKLPLDLLPTIVYPNIRVGVSNR
ncbi:MAG: efflux RND transporter permease subunit, partial [Longimicrobiales bacterium]